MPGATVGETEFNGPDALDGQGLRGQRDGVSLVRLRARGRTLEVEQDDGLVADRPRVVSRRDNEGIAGIDLSLRAIAADDFQPSLDHVPHVLSLAAIRLRNRLDVLGPFPARLMMRADDGHA